MSVVVAYKWAANPQDASVGADGAVNWSRAKAAISDYDPVAIGVAVTLALESGVEAVGVSVGVGAVGSSLAKKAAMSRGLTRGLVVADDAVEAWNATQVAQALADLVGRVDGADLVLTGEASVDENARMMPALIAGWLGWPCFGDVVDVARGDRGWTVVQRNPRGMRTVDVVGPLVAAMAADAIEPRIPGMKDILAAAKKEVTEIPLADLGVTGLPLETVGRERPPAPHRKHQVFSGGDAVSSLVAALQADGSY